MYLYDRQQQKMRTKPDVAFLIIFFLDLEDKIELLLGEMHEIPKIGRDFLSLSYAQTREV